MRHTHQERDLRTGPSQARRERNEQRGVVRERCMGQHQAELAARATRRRRQRGNRGSVRKRRARSSCFRWLVVVGRDACCLLQSNFLSFLRHFFFFLFPPPLHCGVHFFLTGPRGGVTGRPELRPPYWYFAFFSEGFRIWKLHMSVSSTDIMPPALSNSPQ